MDVLKKERLSLKPDDIKAVQKLYNGMIKSWNHRSADKMAGHFSADGTIIDFDGTIVNGKSQIEIHLNNIFINYDTPSYITIIRSVMFITEDVCILHAVAGMTPPGGNDIDQSLNSLQVIVAKKKNNAWLIELLQNTPASFHGRPELSENLSNELREEYLKRDLK